jgi:hypothetical protein
MHESGASEFTNYVQGGNVAVKVNYDILNYFETMKKWHGRAIICPKFSFIFWKTIFRHPDRIW